MAVVTKKCGAIGGPPVDLIVSMQWVTLTAVNTMEQTFEAEIDCSFTAHNGVECVDPSFRGPMVKITNAVTIDVLHDSTDPVNADRGDGTVGYPKDHHTQGTWRHPRRGNDYVWQLHVRGKFAQPFQLNSFPIDVQELGVHFQSKYAVLVPGGNVITKQLVRFVLADREDPTPATLVRQGVIVAPLLCKLRRLTIQVGHTPKHESKRGNIYSKVHSSVIVERQSGFFFWNVIFPSGAFTTMEFLSLLVPAEDLADRLSVTITLLLTLTAYKIVSANSVPDVPHLTLLDKYVVACTIFSAMVACQNGLASTALGDAGNDLDFDRVSGLSLLAAWLAFNVYTLLRWQFLKSKNRLRNRAVQLRRDEGVPVLSTSTEFTPLLKWGQDLDTADPRGLAAIEKLGAGAGKPGFGF